MLFADVPVLPKQKYNQLLLQVYSVADTSKNIMSNDSNQTQVTLDLFYDVRSPYAWVGFEALLRYAKNFSKIKLRLRPVSLVIIGKATGNSTPMNLPAKRDYMAKDLLRLAEYFQMPFNFPKDVRHVMFVKGTHEALCLLTAVAERAPEFLESLSRAFFLRVWSKDEDVTSEDSIRQACIAAEMPLNLIDELIKESQKPEANLALNKTCEEALEHGAFGVPTYVGHFGDGPKMFFGTDRLFLLCHYLNVPFPGPLNELKSSKL